MSEIDSYQNLIAAFWRCVLLDAMGQAVASGEVPSRYRGQSYAKRVMIEREALQQEALLFLDDPNFDKWATVSELDAEELREKLCRLLEP